MFFLFNIQIKLKVIMRLFILILFLVTLSASAPAFHKPFSKTFSLKLKDLLADMNGKNINRHQMNRVYKNKGKTHKIESYV